MSSRKSHNHRCCFGLIESVALVDSMLGAYIHGVPIFIWVPIIIIFAKNLPERKWVPISMGAYIHGVPIIPILRYFVMAICCS